MTREILEEIFIIQTRLFRQFQIERNLSVKEAENIFLRYDVFNYIAICYDFYHIQGDDTNMTDILRYLRRKGWEVLLKATRLKAMSEYDGTMLKLAQMASSELARQQKISKLNAFLKFMNSQTGEMLFDESTDLWMNGPDYLADEYRREMYFKRHKKPMENV